MSKAKHRAQPRPKYNDSHRRELFSGISPDGDGFALDRLEVAAEQAAGCGTPAEAGAARARFDAAMESARQLWTAERDRLMRLWLRRSALTDVAQSITEVGPCSRPWCWWQWSAPEPRRQISSGPMNSTMSDDYDGLGRGKLYFGEPRCCACLADHDCVYESQGQYIERLDLWFDAAERAYWLEHKDDPPPADDDDDGSNSTEDTA